jgi:hypothetical protein
VLHPDHRNSLGTGALDYARYILDNPRGVPGFSHHADLHVYHHQGLVIAFTHSCHCQFLRKDKSLFVDPLVGAL